MNKQDALNASHGTIFYHKTAMNADFSAVRVRVTGRCKTWVTRPEEFRLPVKYGLYQSLAIDHKNMGDYSVTEPNK